jgi:hypothetical protein
LESKGPKQAALLCGCGALEVVRDGMCQRCLRRQRLNQENFDGLRESVLRRDNCQCQICGELDPLQIVVHHRPGAKGLITLCRKHHAMVHHAWRPGFASMIIASFRTLWKELHLKRPEQRLLTEMMAEQVHYQALLFDPDGDA